LDIENRLFGWILDILTMLFILSTVYWLPAVPLGHWIFRVGYWIFSFILVYWLLASGCSTWTLDIPCWILDIEDRLFGWILDILTMLFILSTVYCLLLFRL